MARAMIGHGWAQNYIGRSHRAVPLALSPQSVVSDAVEARLGTGNPHQVVGIDGYPKHSRSKAQGADVAQNPPAVENRHAGPFAILDKSTLSTDDHRLIRLERHPRLKEVTS